MMVVYLVLAALFGLCVGSFLNVVIHRGPRGESIVSPGSICPFCHHPLGPLDLIPVVSFILLRGKCRYCEAPISPRYPLVEAATGALFMLCVWRYDWSLAALCAAGLCAMLVACTMIDLEHGMVLDEVLLFFAVLGLALNMATGALCVWHDALLGVAAGAGPLVAIAFAGWLVTGRRRVVGGGDVKFLAVAGAFLGWKLALILYLTASAVGLIALLVMLMRGVLEKGMKIPFVPILSGGAALSLFFGQWVMDWYFGLF